MNNPTITATAAVAIIRCDHPVTSYLVLRRATHPEDPWSGHFSFPGGRKEPEDRDLLATCIRETEEETGILLSDTQLLKTLRPEPAGQNFKNLLWVQPFLFIVNTKPDITINAKEIASSHWLDQHRFRRTSNHTQAEMVPGQNFPVFPLDDYFLWGFTYRLLSNIVEG